MDGALVSTHMPLARHDWDETDLLYYSDVSTHMPLARHDGNLAGALTQFAVSTHMPLARHDEGAKLEAANFVSFYSHASCEA